MTKPLYSIWDGIHASLGLAMRALQEVRSKECRSITSTSINDAGHLILTFSDETTTDAGLVVKEGNPGPQGAAGPQGVVGPAGASGRQGSRGEHGERGEPGSRIEFGAAAEELALGDGRSVFIRDMIVDGVVVAKVIA